MLQQACEETVLPYPSACRSYKIFKERRQSSSKDTRPGTPITALMVVNINTAALIMKGDE